MSIETWKDEFYPTDAAEAIDSPLEAAEHSLRKWTGMLPENLKKHSITFDDMMVEDFMDSNTCALCEYDDDRRLLIGASSCSCCPLASAGFQCSDGNSPWRRSRAEQTGAPLVKAITLVINQLKGNNHEEA